MKENGRLTGTRTLDKRLKRPLLYQLSYQPYLKIWPPSGSLFLVAEEVQKTSPGSMLMQVFLPLFWFRRWIRQGSSGLGLWGRQETAEPSYNQTDAPNGCDGTQPVEATQAQQVEATGKHRDSTYKTIKSRPSH